MNGKLSLSSRVRCPCCGYPTLTESAAYEICELCNWEDDGQGEAEAGEIWGGPNSDYSLSEARENFKRFRVMYAPGRDQRITPGDSPLEYETKGLLAEAFERLELASESEVSSIEASINRLEQVLRDELNRSVRDYEARQRGEA
jgi:hypothetical protein